jgi:RHS repeat-associated protein
VRDYAGRLRVQTDGRGDVVSNSYVNASGYQDPFGRLQVQTAFSFNPTNSTISPAYTNTFVYDSSDDSNYKVYPGLLYKVIDSQGYEKTGYDPLTRATNLTRYLNINSRAYTTSFTYNDADKVASATYPNSGPTITNLYFNGGTIKQVSLYGGGQNYYTVTANAYDEYGHVTNFVYGNTLSTTRLFYPVSKRLQSVTAGSVFSRTFTYSPGEDILTLNGTGVTNVTVTYDNLHRVKTFSSLTGSYAYDAVGNLTNNIESSSSQAYGYGVRRPEAVKTVGTAKYLYDLCGNMIVRKGNTTTPQSLVYNAENRLVRFASAGSNFMLVTYGYAADGARLWKWNNQNPTNLQVWIGNYYEEKGGKALFHIFANSQQVCTFETNSALFGGSSTDTNHVAYYYSEDNINSSCALSGGSTTVSSQEVNVYYPFGRTMAGTLQASFQVSRRFTGQILDAESGLYYYNARYYDPELGKFIQPDTEISDLSNPQSFNRFSYCVNDPLRYTDPSGHGPISDWWNATREGAGIARDWFGSVGNSIATTLEKPFVTPPQHWDPNSYNALNGGTFGEQIPGVGNPATAPVKAGAKALATTVMMVGPMGEEKAAVTTLKEGKQAIQALEEEGNFVYRGLAKGEDPALGLTARSPGAGNSEISHVAGKIDSQWISTTKDKATAIEKYGQNGVVRIDLNKVNTTVSDVSQGIPNGGRMSNWAKRDQEVLIKDHVPAEAIKPVQ